MMIVVDANIVFSVLIRGEFTLRLMYLLKRSGFRLVTPEAVFDEIKENKNKILRHSKFSEAEVDFILDEVVRNMVKVFKLEKFREFIPKAKEICSDKDDVPYVALSLALNKAPIWSDDKKLKEDCNKAGIKVFSTKEVKYFLFKGRSSI